MNDLSALDKSLNDLIARMRPAARKRAIRRALAHLRTLNRTRIRAQTNADGSPYAPRKKNTNEGKSSFVYRKNTDFNYLNKERTFIGDVHVKKNSYITLRFSDGRFIRLKRDNILKQSKVKKKRKKMLVGFARLLRTNSFGADKGVLNYKSGAVKLARTHHFGMRKPSGETLPARQLMGMSDSDKREAMQIMINSLLNED